MKAVLLYFFFCILARAQSELQTHYSKRKQKCVGEHKITVKSRHSKHGFYIFNYMYSSSKPNNQTQVKKEDNVHIANPIPHPVLDFSDLVDNPTEIEQVTNDEKKNLTEKGHNSLQRTPENNQDLIGHHGNIRKWDLDQRPLEFFEDKRRNEFSTGETEGSGHHFPDQIDFHNTVTTDNKDHEEDEGYQILVKEKDTHSGTANNKESLKHSDIKTGVKENDVIISPEINTLMPKKNKDPQRKDFSKVFLKGSTDAPNKQPDKGESNFIDLLNKGRGSPKLASHLDLRSNLSTEFREKIKPMRTGHNDRNVSKSSGINAPNEKSISNATVGEENTVTIKKLDRPMDTSKMSKPHEKVEVNVDIISNSRVQEININKEPKKDGTTESVIKGQSNLMEVAVPSRKQEKDYGNVDVRGRLINEEVSPDTTNRKQVALKAKLNRFEEPKPPPKGEVTFHTRISGHGRADPNAIEQGKKMTLKVDFTDKRPKEGVGFAKAFREALANREKINRISPNYPERNKKSRERSGATFQDMDNDNEENTKFHTGAGVVSGLKKSNTIESSNPEAERGEKAVEDNTALSLSWGSHSDRQYAARSPKNGHLESQGYFLSTMKKQVPQAGKTSAKVSSGIYRSHATKHHRRHDILKKRKRQDNKKFPSGMKAHVESDSSQSSESKEDSRHDSRQSKDYQNDQLDSYQSSESVELNQSAEKNLSKHHSQSLEEAMTSSQENSKQFRNSN